MRFSAGRVPACPPRLAGGRGKGMRTLLTALLAVCLSLPLLADQKKALFESTKAKALGGDAKAQLNLGLAYANGRGVLKDDSEAAKWIRKAAEQGNAEAIYANGDN